MATKQLVAAKNLGKGFKKNATAKKFELDLSHYIDRETTHLINDKLFAGAEPIYVKDLFRLIGKDDNKTRRLRTGGIHPIMADMPRIYNGNFIEGTTGFPKIKPNRPSKQHKNYSLGERFKSFYNDTPEDQLISSNSSSAHGEMRGAPRASGYVVNGESIIIYLTVAVAYNLAGGAPEDTTDTVTFKKVLHYARGDTDIDSAYERDLGVFSSVGTIIPNRADPFKPSVTADNMEGFGKWEDWEVVEEIPAAVVAGAYTASKGIKKVGNDFQLDLHDSTHSSLKMLPNGKVFVPSSAGKLSVRNETLFPRNQKINSQNNWRGWVLNNFLISFIPPQLDISINDSGQVQASSSAHRNNVQVTMRFTEGAEYIKDVIQGYKVAGRKFSSTGTQEFIEQASYSNEFIADFNYNKQTHTLTFTVPYVYAYATHVLPVMIDVDVSTLSSGSSATVTGEVSCTDKGGGFIMMTLTSNVSFELTRTGA